MGPDEFRLWAKDRADRVDSAGVAWRHVSHPLGQGREAGLPDGVNSSLVSLDEQRTRLMEAEALGLPVFVVTWPGGQALVACRGTLRLLGLGPWGSGGDPVNRRDPPPEDDLRRALPEALVPAALAAVALGGIDAVREFVRASRRAEGPCPPSPYRLPLS